MFAWVFFHAASFESTLNIDRGCQQDGFLIVKSVHYIQLLLAGALCGLLYAAVYRIAVGDDAMMRCDPKGVDATHYMAYCNVKSFTEYDLGAHYFGLEPEAVKSLEHADVLFLGDSRTGHTFSSAATQNFMRRLGVSFYVMGFGYEASSTVALRLIEKYQLRPKAMIINADPFFTYDFLVRREELLSGRPEVYFEYLGKKYFQRVQALLCQHSNIFCGHALTIYRSVVNGAWDVRQFDALHPDRGNPTAIVEHASNRSSELPDARKASRDFVNGITLKPDCIIVTSIPSPHSTQDLAKGAASEINAPYIAPEMTGLRTFDDSHLTPDDSERWSAAMLSMARNTIQECLQ
jgi:hypothetical protein